jgi:hypothetical protein
MDSPKWVERATPVDPVTLEVGFAISDTFYYGPENDITPEQWQTLREPLYQPRVEIFRHYVLSRALDLSATELITYYQDVLRLIARHGKDLRQKSQYFWMRPLIFADGSFDITLSWHDTWEAATSVLDSLASPGDGILYDDLDQGWDFKAYAERDRLFLRESDPDSGTEYVVVSTNRSAVARQAAVLRERVDRVLKNLTAALGQNFWSRNWQR